jgi:hypothetical protein
VTRSACTGANGHYRGNGTTCTPDTCTPPPPPTGACCTRGDNGPVCTVGPAAACRRAEGRYRGNGTTCEPNPCVPPPARGACCIPGSDTTNPRCAIITQANCTEAGGTYGGDNVTCRAANCPTACACDINRNGVLDLRDLFAFLNDYMAGNADFDGDDDTDAADLNAFVTCFQTAPTGCVRAGRGPG